MSSAETGRVMRREEAVAIAFVMTCYGDPDLLDALIFALMGVAP